VKFGTIDTLNLEARWKIEVTFRMKLPAKYVDLWLDW
jgi:hypothetical protein